MVSCWASLPLSFLKKYVKYWELWQNILNWSEYLAQSGGNWVWLTHQLLCKANYHEKHYFNHSRADTLEPPGINYAEIGKNIGSGQNGLDLIKLGAFVDISGYSMKHSKQCG